ncbi:MAG: hypothetical protein DRP11_01870 [Candidatus Aenigmatarchaeota archaeon]|nr:MAG: hypothetical protein DRP11_01870 [Candidatus Aenigmarchaeota archaeon]
MNEYNWFFRLVTPERLNIIRTLLNFPKREWSISDLAEESDSSYATTWRCVRDLENYGIIRSNMIGKTRVFSLVENNPYLQQIKTFLKTSTTPVINLMRGFAREMSKKFPQIKTVILFGSYARGTAKPESDVDILILTRSKIPEEIEKRISEYCSRKSTVIGRKIMPDIMSTGEFRRMVREGDEFAMNIQKEGVVLYGSSRGSSQTVRILA